MARTGLLACFTSSQVLDPVHETPLACGQVVPALRQQANRNSAPATHVCSEGDMRQSNCTLTYVEVLFVLICFMRLGGSCT